MIIWKRTTLLLTAFACASWLATEWFAWTRGFHSALGVPVTHAGIWPVHAPWMIYRWAWAWGWSTPGAFTSSAWVFGLVFGFLAMATLLRPQTTQRPQARWATRRYL